MAEYLNLKDQLELGRELLNNLIKTYYNVSANNIPEIDGILSVEYDSITSLGILKVRVNGTTKTIAFTDPVPSNYLYYDAINELIKATKPIEVSELKVNSISEKTTGDKITFNHDILAKNIDADTVTAKVMIIQETINQSTVENLNIEDRDIVLHSGFTGDYDNNILGDSKLIVNRGSLDDTYLRWDEVNNRWKITNDGTNEVDLIGMNSTGKIKDSLLKEIDFIYGENNTTPGIVIDRSELSKANTSITWDETIGKFKVTDDSGNKYLIGLNYSSKVFDTEANSIRLKQFDGMLNPALKIDRSYSSLSDVEIAWDSDVGRYKVIDDVESFYLTKTMGASQEYTVPYYYTSTLGGETTLELPNTYFRLTDSIIQDANDRYIIFKNSNLLKKTIDYSVNNTTISFVAPLVQNDSLVIFSGLLYAVYEIDENTLTYNKDLVGDVSGNSSANMTLISNRGSLLPAKWGWDNTNEYWFIDNATGNKIPVNPNNIFQTGKNVIAIGGETYISLADLVTSDDLTYIDGLQIDVFKNGMLLYQDEDYTINTSLNRIIFDSALTTGDKIRIIIGRLLNTTFAKNDNKHVVVTYSASDQYVIEGSTYSDVVNIPFEIRPGQNAIKVYVNGILKNPIIDYFELSPTKLKFYSNFTIGDKITVFYSDYSESIKIGQRLLSFDTSAIENVETNPNANCAISVYRGNGLSNAAILWNEQINSWQLTNGDGKYWNINSDQNTKTNSKRYIATGSESNIVSISDIIDPSASIFSLIVHKNGLLLSNTIDYTYNSSTKEITFTTLTTSDIINIFVNYNMQNNVNTILRNISSLKELISIDNTTTTIDIPVSLQLFESNLSVFVNGVYKIEGIGLDYTITNHIITFTNALSSGDKVIILSAEHFNAGYLDSTSLEVNPNGLSWYLNVNRGSDNRAYVRWDETLDKWVYSNGTGIEKEFGGSATSSSFDVTISGHSFSVLNVVRYDSSTSSWVLAKADNPTTIGTHLVTGVIGDTITLSNIGRIDILNHGLTIGQYYFLSDETAGLLTLTEPDISNPIVFVENENTIHVLSYMRALDISEKDFYTNSKFTGTFEVNTDNSLFNHIGNSHQLKINKKLESDTSSILFQEEYVSFAEIGLVQNNNISIKVSDGTNWITAITIDKNTGEVSMPSSTATDEEVIEGINSSKIITPSSLKSLFNYANPIQTQANIFGVQATHQTSLDGVALQHVDLYGQPITLDIDDINSHPAYGTSGSFVETTDASNNVFCTIPIAYWWRGYIDGKWTLLISDKAGTFGGKTFKASTGTFMKNDAWMNQFYIGKYRGSDGGSSKIVSVAGATHLGSVSFDNCRTYCSNNGTDYHMLSLFEWHEIAGRMVIEKATFQLMPEAIRTTQASCIYRGINDFAYGPSSGVGAEWMDGIRTDANGKYEMWNQAQGTYVATNNNCFVCTTAETTYYCQSIYENMDNLFLSDIGGPNSTCFIPDLAGMRSAGFVSKVCYVDFRFSFVYNGVFYAVFHSSSTSAFAAFGCRLAKY